MATLLTQLPTENPDSVGIAAIALPTADELAVYDAVKNWWRADSGVGAASWVDRKNGAALSKLGSSMPVAAVSAAYNGQKTVGFTNLNYALGHDTILSTAGSFSVVTVGRAGPSDNANLWGSGGTGTQTRLFNSTGGAVQFNLNAEAGTADGSATYPRVNANGPYIAICSYDAPGDRAHIRLDRGRWSSNRAATTNNANAHLTVGAAGPAGSLSAAIDGGDIAEVLYFDVPLLATAQADLLATLESYLGTRYAITVP